MHLTQPTENRIQLTRSLFINILLMASIAHITADIYVPSLPSITKALNTTPTAVQFTLAIFMLGFSLSHLFYGPVSDRVGRRSPLLFGLALNIVGSLVCCFAPSVSVLIVGRFIQGTGVGACNSVGRSLLRDISSGNNLARLGSHMGMIITFVTAASPTLGGYIQQYFSWRIVFLVLLVYTLIIWLLTWKKLPETNQHLNPDATNIKTLFKNYFTLLKSKTFIGYSLCSCCAYAGIIAYLTAAPFLLQTIVGLTPVQFGWLAFIIAASIFVSAFINSRVVIKKGVIKMIFIGNVLTLIGGLLMLIFGLLGFINTFVIMFPISIIAMGASFTFSNAFAGAFHPFPKMAGSVGALYGCIQILGAALTSAIMAALHERNQIPLALAFILLGVMTFLSLKFLVSKEE